MSEPSNPYESPKQPPGSAATRAVKAGISSFAILVLMPIAMFVAFCTGCGISVVTVDSLFGQDYDAMILFAILMSFGPPLAVMIGMLMWRSKVRRRELEGAGRAAPHEHAQS